MVMAFPISSAVSSGSDLTSSIDRWNLVTTLLQVNNFCINTVWIEVERSYYSLLFL